MLNLAILPFILVAAGIAFLVLRSDGARRRHASVRPSDLTAPPLPRDLASRSIAPRPAAAAEVASERVASQHVAPQRVDPQPGAFVASLRAGSARLVEAYPALRQRVDVRPAMLLMIGGGLLVVLAFMSVLPAALARPGSRAPGGPQQAAATQPAAAATPKSTATPTPTPALVAESGAPISGDALLAAWTARGLRIAPAAEPLTCGNAKPRAYRATADAGGAGQTAVVFVYASPSALAADWAVERGSPLGFRAGGCTPQGAVTYWNQNVVVVFPQTTDPAVRQQLSDGLLTVAVR